MLSHFKLDVRYLFYYCPFHLLLSLWPLLPLLGWPFYDHYYHLTTPPPNTPFLQLSSTTPNNHCNCSHPIAIAGTAFAVDTHFFFLLHAPQEAAGLLWGKIYAQKCHFPGYPFNLPNMKMLYLENVQIITKRRVKLLPQQFNSPESHYWECCYVEIHILYTTLVKLNGEEGFVQLSPKGLGWMLCCCFFGCLLRNALLFTFSIR